MRGYLLLSVVVGLAIVALLRPKLGVLSIVWFSLMRPDVWAWSSSTYSYALILEAATVIGSFRVLHDQAPAALRNPIVRMLLILQVPILLSVFLALHPSLCYEPYRTYIGCVVSALLIPLLIQTAQDFRMLFVIAALSISYIGGRFGSFGLIHGGIRVGDGYGASLSDNNTLALALAMAAPLGLYARSLIQSRIIRFGLLIAVFTTIGAVIFSHSRGATLSLAGAFLVIIAHSRRRLSLILALAILTVPSIYLVKDSYFDRMATLNNAQADVSAMERVHTAQAASRMWRDYPLIGVGFGTYNQRLLWPRYVDTNLMGNSPLVIHNTYLQMLVDSGTFALLAYVGMLGGGIILLAFSTRRMKRAGSPLYVCPLALEASLVAFAVGSTFLSRVTLDFPYILLMMGASWLMIEPEHLASLEEQPVDVEYEADAELAEAAV